MTILTIRKHQRYAVRYEVNVVSQGARPRAGLLVEVSLEGCRLAIPGAQAFVADHPISVRIGGFGILKATIRWSGDGFVGLKFDSPLHNAELGELIELCRPAAGSQPGVQAARK